MSNDSHQAQRAPIRAAMLDLVSRIEAAHGAGGLFSEERDLLSALQAIVSQEQRPAKRLLAAYHTDTPDMLAGIFAKYAD